jgi:membrane protein implicated in regulation of membrane protease activity
MILVFAAVGIAGTVVLVASLVFDIEGVLPDLGFVSLPVLAAFVTAFGIFGWVAETGFAVSRGPAALIGVAGGVALGVFTARVARFLMRSPTDATPTSAALVGREAKVVTPVRAGGIGEIVTTMAGQPVKLTATADADLPVGTRVTVVAVASPTKVVVEQTDTFWS